MVVVVLLTSSSRWLAGLRKWMGMKCCRQAGTVIVRGHSRSWVSQPASQPGAAGRSLRLYSLTPKSFQSHECPSAASGRMQAAFRMRTA